MCTKKQILEHLTIFLTYKVFHLRKLKEKTFI